MKDAILFYRSFAEAIKTLPEDQQLKALWAVIDYGLDQTEPDDGIAKAIWIMAKPLIDKNAQRYENGKKGGRPKKTQIINSKFNNGVTRDYNMSDLEKKLLTS